MKARRMTSWTQSQETRFKFIGRCVVVLLTAYTGASGSKFFRLSLFDYWYVLRGLHIIKPLKLCLKTHYTPYISYCITVNQTPRWPRSAKGTLNVTSTRFKLAASTTNKSTNKRKYAMQPAPPQPYRVRRSIPLYSASWRKINTATTCMGRIPIKLSHSPLSSFSLNISKAIHFRTHLSFQTAPHSSITPKIIQP